jgi:hypothetical protein
VFSVQIMMKLMLMIWNYSPWWCRAFISFSSLHSHTHAWWIEEPEILYISHIGNITYISFNCFFFLSQSRYNSLFFSLSITSILRVECRLFKNSTRNLSSKSSWKTPTISTQIYINELVSSFLHFYSLRECAVMLLA